MKSWRCWSFALRQYCPSTLREIVSDVEALVEVAEELLSRSASVACF